MKLSKLNVFRHLDFKAIRSTTKFLFNWTIHSKVFLSLITFCFLVNPLTITIIKFTSQDYLTNSLISILLPLLVLSLLLLFLSYKFFNEVKNNYIDSILLNNSITKKQLLITKFLIILALSYIILLFWTLYDLIFFLALKMNQYALSYFISLFINMLLVLFFLTIFTLINLRLKQLPAFITCLILSLVCLTPSLITRSVTKNNNINITYQNPNISFSKIVSEQDTYYLADIKNQNMYDINPYSYINNINIVNYLMPSEWFMSYYNNLFNGQININNNGLNQPYSLVDVRFQEVNQNEIDNINGLLPIIRAQDINPFSLNNFDYGKIINNYLRNLTKDETIIDLNNPLAIKNLLNIIKNNLIWDQTCMTNNQLETLKKLLGINMNYNQMFYLIKYSSLLENKVNYILDNIKASYSVELYDLINFLITSQSTQYNLFNISNVLDTGYDISYYYPNGYSISESKPINNSDLDFITNTLIRFSPDNIPYYLTKDNQYVTNDTFKQFITSLNNNGVNNQQQFITYINQISLQYQSTSNFLNQLKDNANNIIAYSLSNNSMNLDNYAYVLKLIPSPYIWFCNIIITLLTISNLPLLWLMFYFNKHNKYNNGS